MNKIYKLIWSKTKNCWVVASELANSHAKSTSGQVKGSVLAASVLTVLLGSALFPMDAVYAADPVADGQTHYVSVGVKQGEKIKVRKNVYDTNGHLLRVEEEEVEIDPTKNYNPPANPSVNFIGIGADLSQYGKGSAVVGFKSGAAEYGTALGTNARAGSLGDVAIGWKAYTSGFVDTAGKYTAPNKIAIGTQSTALEENGISIGTKSKTGDKNAIAIGNEAETGNASGGASNDSIAIGNKAKIQGQHNVAIGSGVTVGVGEKDSASSYVVAIGSDSHAYDTDSIVIGGNSEVRENATVIGNRSKAGMQSVALGSDVRAGEWSIAIGLSSKARNHAIAMGMDSDVSGENAIGIGRDAKSFSEEAISMGYMARAHAKESLALGNRAFVVGEKITDAAYNALSAAEKKNYAKDDDYGYVKINGDSYYSTAVGPQAKAYGKNATALGSANVGSIGESRMADGGTAVGSKANAAYENATALGFKSIAFAKDAVTIGANTRTEVEGAVALGSESQATVGAGVYGYDPYDESRKQDAPTWKSTKGAVSVGKNVYDYNLKKYVEETRQITNVAAGTENTDAVNVAQLKNLKYKLNDDLTDAKGDLNRKITANGNRITSLSNKVDGNTDNINNLKQQRLTDIKNINQSIEGHTTRFVSVNRENTNDTSDNYLNNGATEIGSIAIGHNAHANGKQAVTLGYNSFTKGQGSVIIGETSLQTTGGDPAKNGQFDQGIIVGSQNKVYAREADLGGREDTILGSKNNITDSHGTFVRGVGNYVADAYNDEVMTADEKKQLEGYLRDNEDAPESPVGLFEKERSHVTVDGDGNAVAGAIYTRVSGVSNEISNSDGTPRVSYNIITGNRNTVIDSSHNLILGDNHELANVNGNIIIGSLTKKAKTKASNVTVLGNDANVSVEGGVALGTGSVADTAAEVAGYDPLTGEASTETGPAWKSGNGAVSVGTADKTRQITNLAAGMADTDAVNVAQLKAIKQKIDNGAIHYFSVRSDDSAAPEGTNWNNDGASGHNAVAIGSFAKAMQKSATAVGAKTVAAGKGANAYGGGIAAGEGTVAIGQNAVAASKPGITQEEYDALAPYQKRFYISDNNGLYYQYQHRDRSGKRTEDEQNYNVAIGSGAESYANQTVSLGYKAKSDVDGGVALGAESSANRQAGGIGYIATGSSATFEDALTTLNKKEDYDKWTAIVDASKKEYDKLTRNFDIARTNERKAEAKAALDAWKEQHADFVEALEKKEKLEATWKGTKGAVSVGKDEINEAGNRVIASRQITHVAAGTEDTDAVNVAQLKTAKTTVEAGDYVTVTKGTKTGVDGTVYTVTGPKLAPKTEDTNIIVEDDIEEATKKKVGYKLSLNKTLTGLESVTSDEFKSGDNVTINKTGLTINGGPSVTTGGIDAGKKKITNVADGDVSATSTDAVNGKQLNELKQNVAENKVTVEAAKDSQIKVTAEKQTDKSTKYVVDIEKDGTIGGAKDGNLVTGKTVKEYVDANKVTVTGDEDESGVKVENTAEPGKPANYKVSLGDKVKIGNVVIDDKDGKGSISGLSEVKVGDDVKLDKEGLTITGGPSMTKDGINAGDKKITNVKDGDVSENSTDAVNGGQLYKLQQTVAGNKVTVEAAKDSQITVTAEKQGDQSTKYVVDIAKDGTIGGEKDGNLVTGKTVKDYVDANKVTVTGDEDGSGVKVENIAEKGQPANYKVSLGDKIKAGDVTVDGTKGKGQITGLSNKTWDADHIVSGRAATEDQLKAVSEKAVEEAKKHTSVVAGDYTTVTESTNESGGKKYTVTGPKLAVVDGEENLVVGDITEGGKKVGYNLKLNKELKGLTSVSSDTFKSGDNVTINKDGLTIKDGPSVKKDGIDAGGKTITNVKDGKADTDAVNVRQLNAIANEGNQNIAILGGKVGELGNRVNRVGAGAAALAALHPLDFDPDDKWDFAAGYGNYKGANAAAIGAYYRPNEDTMVSVGGSFGGGENMVNAGVSVKLGQGNRVTTSRVAMAKEIKDLRAEVEVLRQAVTGIGQGQTPDPVKMKLFPDIAKNHWAYEAVEELTKQGLLEGYPDGTFGGDRMMTRYEFATLVYRAMQKGLNVNEKLIQEFEPELERFRIDVISKDKNGNPVIERVRVNEKKKAK